MTDAVHAAALPRTPWLRIYLRHASIVFTDKFRPRTIPTSAVSAWHGRLNGDVMARDLRVHGVLSADGM
jgi:hypothetical protein